MINKMFLPHRDPFNRKKIYVNMLRSWCRSVGVYDDPGGNRRIRRGN